MQVNDLFGQRSIPHLNIKIKVVVFYTSKEDKDILNKVRDECNTVTCRYSLVPIYVETFGSIINEAIIKKHIKTHVTGYKKDFDKIYIIERNIHQSGKYSLFDSAKSFNLWFQKVDK